jgi:hypothetical protein|tara:strand:+ start:360 stop:665 length:306 start_codon:yes stop_codon:yes gene_type:complete
MNTYNNNIKYTPDFVYTPPSALQPKKETESIIDKYVCKFKTAFYGGLFFAILSLPIAYKILDMIAKMISNNIELFNEDYNEPLPLGRFIMSIIVIIILFIL